MCSIVMKPMLTRRARTFVLAAMAGALASCATPEARVRDEHARLQQAIVGGNASDSSQDSTVMLVVLDPSGSRRYGVCTAALVAPRLVLTARHCVARTDSDVACDADGSPLLGARVQASHDARQLYVFTGNERARFTGAEPPELDTSRWTPASRGTEIVDDGSPTLCNHDLAFVVLDRPIEGIPFPSLRLSGEVGVGEEVLTVGWGVTNGAAEPAIRQQRDGVTVERVGPSDSLPMLTKSEFLFGESICLGDSGGPIHSATTKAIVGVVSRGGNGDDPTSDPAATCIGAKNLGTKLAPFQDLALRAFEKAGAEPVLEPRADEDDAGCSVSAGRVRRDASFAWLAWIGLALAAFARGARRRSDAARTA